MTTTPRSPARRWAWVGRIPPKTPPTTLHLGTLTLLQGGLSKQKQATTTQHPQSSSRASADLPSCA